MRKFASTMSESQPFLNCILRVEKSEGGRRRSARRRMRANTPGLTPTPMMMARRRGRRLKELNRKRTRRREKTSWRA